MRLLHYAILYSPCHRPPPRTLSFYQLIEWSTDLSLLSGPGQVLGQHNEKKNKADREIFGLNRSAKKIMNM